MRTMNNSQAFMNTCSYTNTYNHHRVEAHQHLIKLLKRLEKWAKTGIDSVATALTSAEVKVTAHLQDILCAYFAFIFFSNSMITIISQVSCTW